MYLFQQIEELIMQYNDARKIIAEFVLAEKDRLYTYNMQEVAQYTYTSKATLVRFAKALGYRGWKDFIKAFIEELKYQESNDTEIDVNYPFSQNSTYKEIENNIARLQIESILDTVDKIDEEMIKLAVERILKSNRVKVFGLKPNTYIVENLRWKFLNIGKHIDIAEQGEFGISVKSLTKDDCAIIISYSGNNLEKEPMCYIDTLQKQGVSLIGVTSVGNNYIRERIDCILTISSRERLYSKISNFATEQSMLYLFNILFSCCFNEDYNKNLSYKIENARKLEEPRKTALKVMEES